MSKKSQPRRKPRRTKANTHGASLIRLRDWFLPDPAVFSHLRFHGNMSWTPIRLVWMALIWSWSESRNVTDAFTLARGQFRAIVPDAILTTYQGFMKALIRWTGELMPLLCDVLHRRMEQIGGRFWQVGRWVPIAFDGSRNGVPRTRSNEAAFCAPKYGTGKRAKYGKKKSKGLRRAKNKRNPTTPPKPQVWITLLWHMGLRLPWLWRLGPSNASERGHAMDMIASGSFPKHTLFCGDAGFVGFPLWSRILDSGCDFLVRVGSNVHLLAETADARFDRVDEDGVVLCWPTDRMDNDEPPLRLRLMRVRIGKARVWLLTSVLDENRLTLKQAVEFYTMRWGVEVEFRGLKQTMARARLRCRNDRRVLVELEWSILGLAVAELFTLKEQLSAKQSKSKGGRQTNPDPAKRSLAETIRSLREALRHPNDVPEAGRDLASRLRAAVTDDYVRKIAKRARYCPANPDKKPLGKPKLRQMTQADRRKLKDIEAKMAA